MTTYLDFNATTPVDPRVAEVVTRYLTEEFGNAGSRTHEFGQRAKQAVNRSRGIIAKQAGTAPEGVVFTSGATEANNLALLGIAPWAAKQDRRHVVATAIEHKAVLEPLEELGRRSFEVSLVSPGQDGRVTPEAVSAAVRSDTALVSIMRVNNETGAVQPIEEIIEALEDHSAYFHVDDAQGFGKLPKPLPSRVDMISISGHKIGGPKGIGALVLKRRPDGWPPLSPLMHGGGQERGLRPGTLAVPLIAGLGEAAKLAYEELGERAAANAHIRQELTAALEGLDYEVNGSSTDVVPHTINLSIRGLDAEAAMVLTKGIVAISNGSACTSNSYEPSHVLQAMCLSEERIRSALRLSWAHKTGTDWIDQFIDRVQRFVGPSAS